MGYTNFGAGTPNFIVDYHSLDRLHGRRIDWSVFDATNPAHAPFFDADGNKVVAAGTIMVERVVNDLIVPRILGTGASGAEFILVSNASENARNDAIDGFGVIVGGILNGNLLPDFYTNQDPTAGANADFAAWVTELNGNGTKFRMETYTNNAGI